MSRAAIDVDEVLDRVSPVEGWLRDEQARCLWTAVSEVEPPATVVEIGSYHGKSTIVLASAAPPGVQVFAIDPHAGNDRGPGQWRGTAAEGEADHQRFRANLRDAGVDDRVVHIRAFSHDALDRVPGQVAVLFVDGAHGYRPATADIVDWGGRVAPGGRLLVHDVYNSFFVSLVVMRRLFLSRRWAYEGRERSLAVYVRRDLGLRAGLANLARQVAELPAFVRNMAIKALRATGLGRLTRFLGHEPDEPLY